MVICVAYRSVLCHSHQCLDSQLVLLTPACTRCGYQGEALTMSYTSNFGQNSLWGVGRGTYPKEGVLHCGVLGTLWSDNDDISDNITEKLTLHPFRLFCDYSNSFSLFEGRKLSGSWREQTPTDLRKIQ